MTSKLSPYVTNTDKNSVRDKGVTTFNTLEGKDLDKSQRNDQSNYSKQAHLNISGRSSKLQLKLYNNCPDLIYKSTHDTYFDKKDYSGAAQVKPFVQQLKHQMKSAHFNLGGEEA